MDQAAAISDSLPAWLASFASAVASGAWTEPVAVPAWALAGTAALILILVVLAARAGRYDGGGGLWRLALIGLLAVVAWQAGQYVEAARLDQARAALGERVSRAISVPVEANPLLACANGVTQRDLKAACERTIFAKPEHAAAAVALVRDRLDLLVQATDPVAGLGPDDPRTVRLRRALEADDFGLVASVLAESGPCTPDDCALFAVFKDTDRIRANMAAGTFDALVERQAAVWTPRTGPFGFRQRSDAAKVPSETAGEAPPSPEPATLWAVPKGEGAPPGTEPAFANPPAAAQASPPQAGSPQAGSPAETRPAKPPPQPRPAPARPKPPAPPQPAAPLLPPPTSLAPPAPIDPSDSN